MLQKALSSDVADTFHMLSVDGDTSTNDMVAVLANGMAENEMITAEGSLFRIYAGVEYGDCLSLSYDCQRRRRRDKTAGVQSV